MIGLKSKPRRWRVGRASRKALRVILLLWVVAILAVLLPGHGFSIVQTRVLQWRARSILEAAKTPDQLRQAAGQLGAFYPLGDGSWVAIRYADRHGFPRYSSAVAHDSAGRWYSSNHHFCRRFAAFRLRESELKQGKGREPVEIENQLKQQDADLFALARAANLESARAQLFQLGFTEE